MKDLKGLKELSKIPAYLEGLVERIESLEKGMKSGEFKKEPSAYEKIKASANEAPTAQQKNNPLSDAYLMNVKGEANLGKTGGGLKVKQPELPPDESYLHILRNV